MIPHEAPQPFPHQTEGTAFLESRVAAALFDEQGLGKTRQFIDAVTRLIAVTAVDGALVVCPNHLKTTWAREIEKHSSLSYSILGAGKAGRRRAFASLTAALYVINYEAVVQELTSLRALLRFKRMVLGLDESHRIKSPEAQVTRAVHCLAHAAYRRVIMTGTPVGNKPEDLWSQIFFLDGGATLGATFEQFRQQYCTPAGGYVHIEKLRDRLEGIALRRPKEGTVDLPSKTVTRVKVPLTGRQVQMYHQMRNDLYLWVRSLRGEQVLAEADAILARLVRLAQLASNPALLDIGYNETPAKFLSLDDLLHEIMERGAAQKVIVWTSFVDNIPVLCARYPEFRPVAVFGKVGDHERDRAVEAFQHDPAVRLLVANPAVAREGLTLTSANVAIYLDRTFNLADFLQSQDRIHRLSQTQPCEIYLLIAERTIDEFIDFTLAQKHRLASYTQRDTDDIDPLDLALHKPNIVRTLLAPDPH